MLNSIEVNNVSMRFNLARERVDNLKEWIVRKIKCNNEIKEALWIDRDYKKEGIKVGSILGNHIIPELIKRGLM